MTKRERIKNVPDDCPIWIHDNGHLDGSLPLKSVNYQSIEDDGYDGDALYKKIILLK